MAAPSPGFPITEARITGLFVESITFGVHFFTYSRCVLSLLRDEKGNPKPNSAINWSMLALSSTLVLIAGFDVVLGYYNNLRAFILYKGPGGPVRELTNISDWVNVLKTTTVDLQTIIGDAMLIYRCWIVYARNWRVVAIPTLLWLGGAVCAIRMVQLEITLRSHVLVNTTQIRPFASSFWALTVAVNILATSLIVWRLWTVDNRRRQSLPTTSLLSDESHGPSYLRRATRSIVESGLLYSIFAFTTFVVYVCRSNAIYVMTNMEIQIVGIAFDLIIIRAAVYRAEDAKEPTYHTRPIYFASQQARNQSFISEVDMVVSRV